MFLSDFVVELLYCLILLSNYKGYLTVAKLGTIFYQACIILPFYNLYLGASAGAHLVYIPLSILPLILFRDASLKFKSSIVTGIIGSAFFFLFLQEMMTLSFQVNLNQKTVEVIYSFALLLTFALVLPQVAFFYLTEKKDKQKILEINRNLTVALNDLKESKALQRQLVQYADYAKLVQRIAHEFKNPLQMLQGTAEVGLQHHKNNSQFKVIKDTVGRLNHVIQPLLSYINPEDGYDLKSLNVKEIVSDMLVLCEANCKARNIQISMDGDELTAPFINADKNAMGQVFMNLITNAMEAIPLEGGSIKIKLSSDLFMNNKDIDAVRIDIVDTGCGIEENQLNKIFVPYESSKRSSQNTGLGLSIVMRIINDHDGLIKVDSILGEGTTVSLWFKEQREHVEVVKAEQLFELVKMILSQI